MFFTPYLGLFSLLQHWKSEQIPIAPELQNILGENKELFREDPSSEYYMGSLLSGYQTFLVLQTLHLFLIYCIKMLMSKNFRRSSCWSKFQDVLNNIFMTDSDMDWSNCKGDVGKHKQKQKSHLMEVIMLSTLHGFINFAQLVPLWISGTILTFSIELFRIC